MPYCLFEISTGIFHSGRMHEPLPHDPAVYIQLSLDTYPNRRTQRWDGSTGIRNATAQEISDYDQLIIDSEAANAVNVTKHNKFLFEIFFDHENRIRQISGQPSLTRTQFRTALINLYKSL